MSSESGWQWRLCATLCLPPVPRVRFDVRNPSLAGRLQLFEKQAAACMVLGFLRTYVVQFGMLNDFLTGGSDVFSAALALFASYDCCACNGSFLFMFLVWSLVNAVLFDFFFSLLSNWANPPDWSVVGEKVFWALLADSVLILVLAGLQVWMAMLARDILDEAVPHWRNIVTYGSESVPGSSAVQQPLLREPAYEVTRGQPQGSGRPAAGGGSFKAFGGGGQRLGGGDARRI